MIFFIRSIFPQILLNAYIIHRIRKSNIIPSRLKGVLYLIYVTEILLYFTGLFAGERFPVEIYTFIQKINGVWVVGHVYICMLLVFFWIVDFIDRKYLLFKKFSKQAIRRIKFYCFLIFPVFIGFRVYVSAEDVFHPEVRQIPFEFNKPENSSAKPEASYRILVVSDLHLGYIVHSEMLKQYVEFINSLYPDIVVIDGDLVDYALRPLIAGKMDDELRKIKAPKGIFFIPGNHEYKFNPELKLDWISRAGLTVLKDSVANIDNYLYLIGRDDRSNKKRLGIEELISKVDPTKSCIFLAHQPGDIKDAYHYGIPLTVCGHTHGGQVFPMNLAGRLLYVNSYGLQKKGKSYSYTTSGLGLSGFPMRIGSNSEVVIFNIKIY